MVFFSYFSFLLVKVTGAYDAAYFLFSWLHDSMEKNRAIQRFFEFHDFFYYFFNYIIFLQNEKNNR